MISVAALLISMIAMALMIVNSSRELRDEAFNKVREIAYQHSHEVEKELGETMSMTRAFAISVNDIVLSERADSRASIMRSAGFFLEYLPEGSAVWALFEPGSSYTPLDRGESSFTPYACREKGILIRKTSGLWKKRYADLYLRVAQTRQEMVSEVFRGQGETVLITSFCVPVVNGSGVLGVVGIDLVLSNLSKRLARIQPMDEKSYAFMISNGGIFVAHPWAVYLGHNISEPKFGAPQATIESVRQGREVDEIHYSSITDRDWYVYFVPVKIGKSDAPWSFGITVPLPAVLEKSRKLIWIGIMNSVIFSLVLLVALFMIARSVSTPVQKKLGTLNMAIEQASEAVCIIGLDRKVQFVNPAMEKTLGVAAADLIGGEPLLRNTAGEEVQQIWDVLEKGGVWSGVIIDELMRFNLNVNITPVRNERDSIICYLEIGHDITQELLMETRLRQSQKMEAMGTLAGGIAHDFNNILSAIFGYGELALSVKGDSEKSTAYIEDLLNAAARARDLVNRILNFSRRTEQEYSLIEPRYLISEVMKFLRASLPSTVEIREKINSSASIMGDATLLHQVVMNLCTNAAHAMHGTGGLLSLSLDDIEVDQEMLFRYPELKPGLHVRLTVSDTGHGISQENLERIFDPFFTTKEKGSGTGLGLSVAHNIVKNFGGIITVRSEIGRGTDFTVYLPALQGDSLAAEEETVSELPGGSGNILFVDDEPHLLAIGHAMLQSAGYHVSIFTESAAALNEFSRDPFFWDLVISDYTMPKLTGLDLAEKMLRMRPDVPIVLFSGYFDDFVDERARELGVKALIGKPLRKKELGQALRFLRKHP
jgi:PAS domain S-box-containing protein